MITKIAKLNKFGIFQSFQWKNELPDFKKFNLIYGWNRSGKTTVSRCFSACEKKTTAYEQYPREGEFEISVVDSSTVKSNNLENCNLPIKVFNRDFIDDNIGFDPSNACNAIVYVGEENIESKNKLAALKDNLIKLDADFRGAQKNKKIKEDVKTNFLQSLGREIAKILFDKTYNKAKAENCIKTVGTKNFDDKILSEDEEKKLLEISRGEAKAKLSTFPEYEESFSFNEETISDFKKIYSITKELLEKHVVSETIERLKNDEVLNNWVKEGYDLFKSREEKETCPFCEKPLERDFLESLSKHFNEDYDKIQVALKIIIEKIKSWKRDAIAVSNQHLYPDLKNEYERTAVELNTVIGELDGWIDKAVGKLQEKYKNPLSIVEPPEEPKDFAEAYNTAIRELTKVINRHNEKVDNHADEVKVAKRKIELHSIAEAIKEQDYDKLQEDLDEAGRIENSTKESLAEVKAEIANLEKETSNIGKALKEINRHLEEFFGRKEIQLELDSDKRGYVIIRDGQLASNLSEGEKTAIAFSYFVVKVRERDFKTKDGIIFIDDPISSLDSNFIYHCFSLIKHVFGEAGQLFVSTHNFELFNLLKKWLVEKNRRNLSKGKEEVCGFYMIENYIDDGKRKASVKTLDNTLLKFNSEYHFLFSQLYNFAENDSPEYKDLYTVSNIARRFLEIFTNFKIPTTGDLASKIDALEISPANISKTEQGKVYKLIQEFSHGSDPASAIEHKDKIEIQEAIKVLLNMIKESDQKHFELLKKAQ